MNTELRNTLEQIARIIAQDGEIATDGECLGEVWSYLQTLGIDPDNYRTEEKTQ